MHDEVTESEMKKNDFILVWNTSKNGHGGSQDHLGAAAWIEPTITSRVD
jgi:hypothetical protein